MKRGEVRWAEHPDWPRRPALLLTRNAAIDHLNEVFVVLATTNVRGLRSLTKGVLSGFTGPVGVAPALGDRSIRLIAGVPRFKPRFPQLSIERLRTDDCR